MVSIVSAWEITFPAFFIVLAAGLFRALDCSAYLIRYFRTYCYSNTIFKLRKSIISFKSSRRAFGIKFGDTTYSSPNTHPLKRDSLK